MRKETFNIEMLVVIGNTELCFCEEDTGGSYEHQ